MKIKLFQISKKKLKIKVENINYNKIQENNI